MKKLSLLLSLSLFSLVAVACGTESPCEDCTEEVGAPGTGPDASEEVGQIQQGREVGDTALCCWCDPMPPGCYDEEPEPEPTTLGYVVTNNTTSSTSVEYSIVVADPYGVVRTSECRSGTLLVEALGSASIPSPANANVGDHVTASLRVLPDGSFSQHGFDVTKSVTCHGSLSENWGTVTGGVSCY